MMKLTTVPSRQQYYSQLRTGCVLSEGMFSFKKPTELPYQTLTGSPLTRHSHT